MTDEVKVLSDKQLEEIRFDIKNTKPTSSLQGLFRQHCETLLAENTALREQLAQREQEWKAFENLGKRVEADLRAQLAQLTRERDRLQEQLNSERALDIIAPRALKKEASDAIEELK